MRAPDLTSDVDVLFCTLCGEAENQKPEGMQGVANAILNRVALASVHPHFGDGTIKGACRAPYQFSCWLPGPDYERIIAIDLDNMNSAQRAAMNIAQAAVAGGLQDITGEATHYFATSIPAPNWVTGDPARGIPAATFTVQIGAHRFYKGVQ